MSSANCDASGSAPALTDLRIAPLLTLWITGTLGAAYPILAHSSGATHIPRTIFELTRYFGSGVIIYTAFIHLLVPAISKLTSPCLGAAWRSYPYPLTLALLASFAICIIGIVAFHIGTAKLIRLGINYDPHGYRLGAFVARDPETESAPAPASDIGSELGKTGKGSDLEFEAGHAICHIGSSEQASLALGEDVLAQSIGVAVLEFGTVLHSVLIGLTLAIDKRSEVIFLAIIFYQIFDGLALGSRLAYLDLPHKYRYVPLRGALLYGITTPIGIAMGFGMRMIYNPSSVHMGLFSGVLESLSAGILMYSGFVELPADGFLFKPEMHETGI